MRFRSLALGALAALSLVLAACGGDDTVSVPAVTTTAPTGATPQATAPSATEPPPDATTPPPGGAEHRAREEENRAEEPVESDAAFVITKGRLRPRTITVPAFIAAEVRVANLDRERHVVVVRADRDYRIRVRPTSAEGVTEVPGQRAGRYPVLVDGRRRGTLVFGGEPGP